TPWPMFRRDPTHTAQTSTTPTLPDVPVGVSASKAEPGGGVGISWTSAPRASGYELWRSTTNDPSTAVRLSSQSVPNFYDRTPAIDVNYYYWVIATNLAGRSGF